MSSGGRLRNAVDPESINLELLRVVDRTIAPGPCFPLDQAARERAGRTPPSLSPTSTTAQLKRRRARGWRTATAGMHERL